jgi:hypothetical protein
VSAIVCAGALVLASRLFSASFYVPLATAILVCFIVTWFRFRGLKSGLPKPYGRGRSTSVNARKAMRGGILIMLGGILGVVLVLGSVYFLPPVAFFALVFGLMAGLPLEELVFFSIVTRLERTSKTRIFSVTEETTEDEDVVLVKTIEMSPHSAQE